MMGKMLKPQRSRTKIGLLLIYSAFLMHATDVIAGVDADYYHVAKRYLEQGKTEQAILKFIRIIKHYPHSQYVDEALYRVGEYHYSHDNFFNAERELTKHLALYPDSRYKEDTQGMLNQMRIQRLLYEVETSQVLGDWQRTYDQYKAIMRLEPANRESKKRLNKIRQSLYTDILRRADGHFEKENYEQALTLYTAAGNIKGGSLDKMIKTCKQEIAVEKRQLAQGRIKFRGEWYEKNEIAAIEALERGDREYIAQNYKEALAQYQQALQLNSKLATLKDKVLDCKNAIAFEVEQEDKGLVKYNGKWIAPSGRKLSKEELFVIWFELSQSEKKVLSEVDRQYPENPTDHLKVGESFKLTETTPIYVDPFSSIYSTLSTEIKLSPNAVIAIKDVRYHDKTKWYYVETTLDEKSGWMNSGALLGQLDEEFHKQYLKKKYDYQANRLKETENKILKKHAISETQLQAIYERAYVEKW